MRLRAAALALIVCAAAVAVRWGCPPALTPGGADPPDHRPAADPAEAGPDRALVENAYRANNLGVAWLERFDYTAAAGRFREALALHPTLGLARFNLALALFYDNRLDDAGREARLAAEALPGSPHAQHLLGLVARAQDRPDEAAAAFARVLEIDPTDAGAAVLLGQVRLQQGDATAAVAAFERALVADPANATAAYNLSLAFARAGRRDEGQRMLARFQSLRESGAATTLGTGYLQQGRYAEAMVSTGREPDVVAPGLPAVRFVPVGDEVPDADGADAAWGGGLAAIDVDADGDLDLLEIAHGAERFWRNERGGRLAPLESPALPARPAGSVGIGAVAGDLDNDGRPDLLVLRDAGAALYRGGARGFEHVPVAALRRGHAASPQAAALVDVDHDGDLDLLVAAAAGPRLLRNDAAWRFTDVTAASGLGSAALIGVVPTDYDERRDVDLLAVPAGGPLALFRNGRDGTFTDAASAAGLATAGRWSAVAAGDLNLDGRTDVFLGREDAPGLFLLSDGAGRFRLVTAPPATHGTRAAQLIDYDNDGLLDLLVFTRNGVRLLRNAGDAWLDAGSALPDREHAPPAARGVLAADLDGDGDTDLIVHDAGAPRVWRNDGGSAQPALAVRLTGHVSNRSGIGAKVELRAGSLRGWRELTAVTPPIAPADLLFGLGARSGVDAVRVLWPSGVLQAEWPEEGAIGPLGITELDRKPSSCPFLFAWDGRAFGFVTDFLGGGELGYWLAPGIRGRPDRDEYVRMAGDALRPIAGRYELRVTNELEEALFLDAVRLLVIDHPAGVEVHPDEGLTSEPRTGLRLHAIGDLVPPEAATDDEGRDVLDLVTAQDLRAPDDFPLLPIRGYARPHGLVVTRARVAADRLLLTGWTDYAFSSDNVAASQAGIRLTPPAIEVRGADGRWRATDTAVPVPAGRPQTVVVDLARHGLAGHRTFRIATSMRIYWDQVRFGRAAAAPAIRRTLRPAAGHLRWRGFSAPRTAGPGAPSRYAYDVVSTVSPWKQLVGFYTPEGDVGDLVAEADDRFVTAGPGDEIALAFDASRDAWPASGRARTFLLHAEGYSKEMDLHSASPDTVGPLPYRGMTDYPPSARSRRDGAGDVRPPRRAARTIPLIDTLLLRGAAPRAADSPKRIPQEVEP